MFCPNCRSEYRQGFAQCSDCGVGLVEILTPPNPQDPELSKNERPDLASTHAFLAWFLPMSVYVILNFGVWVRPVLMKNMYFICFLVPLILAGNLGTFWMLYQAVRYERRVWRYVLLSMVPFMFVWYSIVRLPLRKESQGKANFIR